MVTLFSASCIALAATTQVLAHDTIDAIFGQFDAATPGCAVGVQRPGLPRDFHAFGTADLEHKVPNSVDTVFEAGSVSKQFTAAAILLLVADNRLSLDDDIRKYLPEMPDYGATISIAMLLNHTSGLRDWGDIQDAAGWPRGDRVFSLQSILHIAAAQRSLNFRPGSDWSYTNTGYNLAAIVVERISGKSLAEFSRDRIFAPLRMDRTTWRDDFRAIVPDRAIGYRKTASGYKQDMPFESAYGNGGLLTTVGDLLTWNRTLTENRLGSWVSEKLLQRTILDDGRTANYGFGVYDQRYGKYRELSHAGATAGYTAWLGRYPENGLSLAILCNSGSINTPVVAHAVADLYLPEAPTSTALTSDEKASLQHYAGWYVDQRSGSPYLLLLDSEKRLRLDNGPHVMRRSGGNYALGGNEIKFQDNGTIVLVSAGLDIELTPVAAFQPGARLQRAIAGDYYSPEANVHYAIKQRDGSLQLHMKERPEIEFTLEPAYDGAFTFGYSVLRYATAPDGRVDALRISSPRLWDLRMQRIQETRQP